MFICELFIEHKTLYYDVAPFKFYVLTEKDKDGYHPVENDSNENYNLACILTFPPHQRKGYGRFLMSLSYEMSKKAGILDSPEKPLSDLGKLSYRSFWTYCILSFLRQQPVGYIIKLEDIVKSTGFKREDIISTIHHLGMLKEWKGQFVIHYTRSKIGKILEPYDRKKFDSSFCKPEFLIDDGGGK
jgi:histone acetyltransferase MYST1